MADTKINISLLPPKEVLESSDILMLEDNVKTQSTTIGDISEHISNEINAYSKTEVDDKLSEKVSEAPTDGKIYGRRNGEWSETEGGALENISETSGDISLTANKSYKMSANNSVNFIFPTTDLDISKENKIQIYLKITVSSINITFSDIFMSKDGTDMPSLIGGRYLLSINYNVDTELWEISKTQFKFLGANVRKVADFSSEIPAGYVVSHVANDGAALETAANNTAELVFPLQDTPYNPAFPRMQWSYSSFYVIRYKIKMPSARKILSYSVQSWAENGYITDRIMKSWRLWAAVTDVDITAANWKDNCILIDEQVNAFTSYDHNVTKNFPISLDVNALCLILEPTANNYGSYITLGQIRFFGK